MVLNATIQLEVILLKPMKKTPFNSDLDQQPSNNKHPTTTIQQSNNPTTTTTTTTTPPLTPKGTLKKKNPFFAKGTQHIQPITSTQHLSKFSHPNRCSVAIALSLQRDGQPGGFLGPGKQPTVFGQRVTSFFSGYCAHRSTSHLTLDYFCSDH